MIPYSLHVALLLAFCLGFYKLLLQKETYYRLNRWLLLGCLALAFLLPLIPVPQKLSLRNAIAVQQPEQLTAQAEQVERLNKMIGKISTIAPNATAKQAVEQVQSAAREAAADNVWQFNRQNMWKWAIWLYWAGVVIFAGNFLLQLIALFMQGYKKPVIKDSIYRIVELDDDKAPCSFGNTIFINPAKYDWETYKQILLHEKIHVKQGHSIDLIMAELMVVLQWFNPFAWLYRKEVENNLEFLTDDAVIRVHQVEIEAYQMSLLKVSVPNYAMHVTTSYNQSLLKKRILMMNTKRSNIHTSWKYLMLAPLLVVLICAFNKQAPASAKKENLNTLTLPDGQTISFKHDTTVTLKAPNGKTYNGKVTFTPDAVVPADYAKRFKDAGYKDLSPETLQALASQQITPEYIQSFIDIGYKDVSIKTMQALAIWGINAEYVKSFMDINYDTSVKTVQTLSAWGISADWVKEFKNIGYDTSIPTIKSLTSWGITPDFVKSFKSIGYDTSLPTLQTLTSWGITADYIKGFKDIGYEDVSLKTLQAFTSYGITPEFIKGFKDIGYKDLSVKTLQGFMGSGVTPKFVKSYNNYKEVSADKITSAGNFKRDVKLEILYNNLKRYTTLLKPVFMNPKLGDPSIKADLEILEKKFAASRWTYDLGLLSRASAVKTEFEAYPNIKKQYVGYVIALEKIADYTNSPAYLAKLNDYSAEDHEKLNDYLLKLGNDANRIK